MIRSLQFSAMESTAPRLTPGFLALCNHRELCLMVIRNETNLNWDSFNKFLPNVCYVQAVGYNCMPSELKQSLSTDW